MWADGGNVLPILRRVGPGGEPPGGEREGSCLPAFHAEGVRRGFTAFPASRPGGFGLYGHWLRVEPSGLNVKILGSPSMVTPTSTSFLPSPLLVMTTPSP